MCKSLIYTSNNNGPKIEPCGTPALILAQEETCPLITTLCFVLPKKISRILNKSPELKFCSSLKRIPSCQTLSNALEMSKKTLLTTSPLSEDLLI